MRMALESKPPSLRQLSVEERSHVRHVVQEASESFATFVPKRTTVVQSLIHGSELLPFDQHVRKGKHLLDGMWYLENEEYRKLYRAGRIKQESLARAFLRMRFDRWQPQSIQIENRKIDVLDVWRLHLIVGFDALEPRLLERELGDNGSTKQFHQHLSEESRRRIIDRTIQECELCREYPEKAYLANLWKSILSVLQLSESHVASQQIDRSVFSATETASLPAQRTISDWVDSFGGGGLVGQANDQLFKWITAFLDEGVVGWRQSQVGDDFYQTWRQMVQENDSATCFGIKCCIQRTSDLPMEPEDTIASSLRYLGIPQEQWREYLARHLWLSLGWMRYFRWLEEHPDYHVQCKHPIDTTQYLAVRLFYEVELTHSICQQEWGIEGTVPALTAYWNRRLKEYTALVEKGSYSVNMRTQHVCRDAWRFFQLAQFLELSPIDVFDLSCGDVQTILQWLDDFPLDHHRLVWQEAYEESSRADRL